MSRHPTMSLSPATWAAMKALDQRPRIYTSPIDDRPAGLIVHSAGFTNRHARRRAAAEYNRSERIRPKARCLAHLRYLIHTNVEPSKSLLEFLTHKRGGRSTSRPQ